MPTHRDFFRDDPEACSCASCGRSFVPEEDYHEHCDKCWDRKQRRRPRRGESEAAWIERLYGERTG